jgi:hypothetical protein
MRAALDLLQPLIVSTALTALAWLFGRVASWGSGWTALARRFPCPAGIDGRRCQRVTVQMDPEQKPMRRQFELTIAASGLRLGHRWRAMAWPEVLLPWDSVRYIELDRTPERMHATIRLFHCGALITVFGEPAVDVWCAWMDKEQRGIVPPPPAWTRRWWSRMSWSMRLLLLQIVLGVLLFVIFALATVTGVIRPADDGHAAPQRRDAARL